MARKIKGFTLIEVIVVIAIIAILLAIAIPSFLTWKAKYILEQDVQNLTSFINMARNKAFTEKINLVVNINGKLACISCKSSDTYCNSIYSGSIQCISLKNNFGSYSIGISSRGTLKRVTIYPAKLINNARGCVKLSTFRAKIGVINGATCKIR